MIKKILDTALVIEGLEGWMMISKIPDTVSRKCDICKEPFADVQVIDWNMKDIAIHWACVEPEWEITIERGE